MKRQIKLTLAKCLSASYFDRLTRSLTGRRHLILLWHHVRSDNSKRDPYDTCPSVSKQFFRDVLLYTKQHYKFVSLKRLSYARDSNTPLAAVTLDDGWRDNYDVAFPILKELGIPATIFVTTGRIGSSEPFWPKTIGNSLRLLKKQRKLIAHHELNAIVDLDENTIITPILHKEIVEKLNLKSFSEQQRLLSPLEANYKVTERKQLFLSKENIVEMSQSNIDFGSHTVNHVSLSNESSATVYNELLTSKKQLEEITGKDVDMLAYPRGAFTSSVVKIARELGYRIGCSTKEALVSKKDDIMLLPRIEFIWSRKKDSPRAFDSNMYKWKKYRSFFRWR